MGFIKYTSKEERDEARKVAYAKKLEYLKTPDGRRWKRNEQLKSLYGITIEDFEKLSADQGDACKVCLSPASSNRFGALYVDHCHSTGRIRGLLCSNCNTAIGLLRDCPDRLSAAIKYIEEA